MQKRPNNNRVSISIETAKKCMENKPIADMTLDQVIAYYFWKGYAAEHPDNTQPNR
jgi:hypothetical protein